MTQTDGPGGMRHRLRSWIGVPDEVTRRLNRQHDRIAELEREVARLSPQVAALEERMVDLANPSASLSERRTGVEREAGDRATELDPAALLRKVRAEHSRVRARISAAARYEERLAQLEEKMEALEDRP